MKSIALILWPVIFILGACEKDNLTSWECDQKAVVNEAQFANTPSDDLTIYETEVHGDCLRIKFASNGCSGDSWKVKLVASEKVYYSLPPQKNIRLSFENEELCEAYITKEMTFDVTELRSSGDRSQLNIVNGDTSVLYEY